MATRHPPKYDEFQPVDTHRDRWFFKNRQEAEDYAANLRETGYSKVKIRHAKGSRLRLHPPGYDWMVFWGPYVKSNPPSGWQRVKAVKIERKRGTVVVRVRR